MLDMPHKDPRGHVEFLQASELSSASYIFGDLSPGLRAFELVGTPSCDSTLLVNGSPLWRFHEDVVFRSDVEILILAGDLMINNTALRREIIFLSRLVRKLMISARIMALNFFGCPMDQMTGLLAMEPWLQARHLLTR